MPDACPKPSQDKMTALVAAHAAGVQRYLRVLTGDAELARDLVQETFLKLNAHADVAGSSLVFTIARCCALDHLRRRRVRNRFESPGSTTDLDAAPSSPKDMPDRTVENGELGRALHAALAALPEDQRSVFHLSEIEGLTYAEIAAVLDISPGTVASRKHHAVRRMRDHLERRGHGA